jgi:hypothetical protein
LRHVTSSMTAKPAAVDLPVRSAHKGCMEPNNSNVDGRTEISPPSVQLQHGERRDIAVDVR